MLKERMAETTARMKQTQQQVLAKQQEMRELHAEITKMLGEIERDKERDGNSERRRKEISLLR